MHRIISDAGAISAPNSLLVYFDSRALPVHVKGRLFTRWGIHGGLLRCRGLLELLIGLRCRIVLLFGALFFGGEWDNIGFGHMRLRLSY